MNLQSKMETAKYEHNYISHYVIIAHYNDTYARAIEQQCTILYEVFIIR